ncbi:MAG: hypothetical protein HN341_19640 [Verrucomicrobia bacterium]|nr:hypothetical protein [Verrucomicrobiota bacterium]
MRRDRSGRDILTRPAGCVYRACQNAAFMTYVAAAISALLTLVYYLMRAGLLGGSDG